MYDREKGVQGDMRVGAKKRWGAEGKEANQRGSTPVEVRGTGDAGPPQDAADPGEQSRGGGGGEGTWCRTAAQLLADPLLRQNTKGKGTGTPTPTMACRPHSQAQPHALTQSITADRNRAPKAQGQRKRDAPG